METKDERHERNVKHCRHIANELEAYAAGRMWRCPECGHEFDEWDHEEDPGDWERCPECGDEAAMEQLSCWDWMDDALDVSYTMNRRGEYKGASVLVAFGGPNVYVDTNDARVKLYWWGDRAEWGIAPSACDALDDALEEEFMMVKGF